MLYWAVVFLVIAVVAALLGFGGIASAAAGIAKFLFFLFVVVFVILLVQLVMIKYPISCGYGRCVCHDFGHRFRGPVERMCLLIPFRDELVDFGTQLVFGFEVGDS
jgi:uncharacterized membrane protein YtjA (UPF0391 family)